MKLKRHDTWKFDERLEELVESILEGYDQNNFFDMAIWDMEDNDEHHSVETILSEFYDDKSRGRAKKYWRTIPADQYRVALQKFMKEGENFNFPESTLRDWLYIMIGNTMDLEIMTSLAGHTEHFPSYEVEDYYKETGTDIEDIDFTDYYQASEFLDKEGYYDWAALPDGSDAISDYGIKPLWNVFQSLPAEPSASEMIVAINRALDVTHCRGDLSSMFISGGPQTLTQISNESAKAAKVRKIGMKILGEKANKARDPWNLGILK